MSDDEQYLQNDPDRAGGLIADAQGEFVLENPGSTFDPRAFRADGGSHPPVPAPADAAPDPSAAPAPAPAPDPSTPPAPAPDPSAAPAPAPPMTAPDGEIEKAG